MADEDEKAKAEKIAAARKRVAQLQKLKAKKAGKKEKNDPEKDEDRKQEAAVPPLSIDTSSATISGDGEKAGGADKGAVDQRDHVMPSAGNGRQVQTSIDAAPDGTEPSDGAKDDADKPQPMPMAPTTMPDETTAPVPAPITTTTTSTTTASPVATTSTTPTTRHARAPSLSQQSKLRSSSFRKLSSPQTPTATLGLKSPSLPPLTSDPAFPAGSELAESAPELFRKQGLRLDEAERENRRLSGELAQARQRATAAEEALEEAREANAEIGLLRARLTGAEERAAAAESLEAQVKALERRLVQATSAARSQARAGASPDAGVTSPDQAQAAGGDGAALQEQLASREATIEAMQVEISNLKAKLNGQATGQERVTVLEDTISKLEAQNTQATEALRAASENAQLLEGERGALQSRVQSLQRHLEECEAAQKESEAKLETLEKKLATLGNLHKDSETRHQLRSREREKLEREVLSLRRNLATIESENVRLREERDRVKQRSLATGGGDVDDAALDELEDEERQRLERRVRELEGEVFDLRRGVWREKRIEMQVDMPEAGQQEDDGQGRFDDVDLMAPGPSQHTTTARRLSLRSTASQQSQSQRKHSSFATVLSSGLAAFTGQSVTAGHQPRSSPRVSAHGYGKITEELLPDDDEAFDEEAFARAQAEEEMKKRVEATKQVKRELKKWKGWRLDLVNARYGAQGAGVGYGEIFEV